MPNVTSETHRKWWDFWATCPAPKRGSWARKDRAKPQLPGGRNVPSEILLESYDFCSLTSAVFCCSSSSGSWRWQTLVLFPGALPLAQPGSADIYLLHFLHDKLSKLNSCSVNEQLGFSLPVRIIHQPVYIPVEVTSKTIRSWNWQSR